METGVILGALTLRQTSNGGNDYLPSWGSMKETSEIHSYDLRTSPAERQSHLPCRCKLALSPRPHDPTQPML